MFRGLRATDGRGTWQTSFHDLYEALFLEFHLCVDVYHGSI